MDKRVKIIEEKVYSYIRNNNMLKDCSHIVAGVSGGADSVCLLLMLCDYVKRYRLDTCIHAVHVNHMIRQEAADDEQFTLKLCERLGVSCKAVHIDCIGIAKKQGLTVEEAGRLERYRIFRETAAEYEGEGRVMIAVAHHMNDQAETVIMNMARGTSLKGVRGIVPVRDNICRPLLCITRKQIEEVLKSKGQDYVTDVTNYDNDYTRNAIRNVILPYMCEHINKRAVENIASMTQDIREAEEYMERQTDRLYHQCVTTENTDSMEDIIKISVEPLKNADKVLSKRVIYKCLVNLAGRAKDIYSVNVADILSLVDMQTGKMIHSVYGIQALREYDYIILRKKNIKTDNKKCKAAEVTADSAISADKKEHLSAVRMESSGMTGQSVDKLVQSYDKQKQQEKDMPEYMTTVDISRLDTAADTAGISSCEYDDNGNVITEHDNEYMPADCYDNNIKIGIDTDIYIHGEGIKHADSITFSLIDKKTLLKNEYDTSDNGKILVNKSNNIYAKYYDYDKINKLLDIRFRKSQDDIVVSKDGNSKKLKKELVDRKIPSAYRQKVLLVCDKNHVLWACGVRRCENCLVDDNTSRVLQILINMKERN